MRVFLDTNIILDVALERKPFFEASNKVVAWCGDEADSTVIAWHTFTNVYYILSRQQTEDEAREFLRDLMSWANLAPVSERFLHQSLETEGDLEDVLQYLCAEAAAVDLIVTRNIDDFHESPVRACTATQFLETLP